MVLSYPQRHYKQDIDTDMDIYCHFPRFRSLDWFTNAAGETIKPSELTQVVGFWIAANMAINVTAEVAQIYFDNFVLSET